jgi:tetratricopeptide (TPR) repeat protein
MIRTFNAAYFLILSLLFLFPSLLLAVNSDLPANFTAIAQTGENLFKGNEADMLGCQEEAVQNNFERYLMEADENEGESEMKIYAETMTQINVGTEDIEKLAKRLLDAQVKYPQSRHIHEALGWFYQRMYESSNDKSKLVKAVDAFIRAENFHFGHSALTLYSNYSDMVSKILIILNDKKKLDDYFSVILERHPSDMFAHLSYAKALSSFSDSQAELYFEKAISLKDKDNFQPTIDYVEHLLDMGKYEKALSVLNKEKSEAYYLHFLKGYTLEKLGKFKEAEEEYRCYLKFKEITSFGKGFFKPDVKYRIPESKLQKGIDFKEVQIQSTTTCPNPQYSTPCASADWECNMRTYAVWAINGEAERNNGTLGMMRAVAWNIRNRVFSPTSSVYCPGQFTCTNYAYCYPLSLVKWPSDPNTLYQRYFQVINTGRYAGLQFTTYTWQSEQVFFDVFNGLVPDPYSGKCPTGILYGGSCSGTCLGSTPIVLGSFPSYRTGMEFRAGKLYPKDDWGYHCYEFKPMGQPDMGNCSSQNVPCFINQKVICPRYATSSDNILCYSDGIGPYYYTGPVYGNFFWSTNGGVK